MRTIAILPVKSFGAAKQRLAGLLGSGAREALVQAMFGDVLAALRHVPGLDEIAVVTANPTVERAAYGDGVTVLADRDETGHSEAAAIGVRHALAHGFDRALLVPGDTPLLAPAEVGELLAAEAPTEPAAAADDPAGAADEPAGAAAASVVVVPDRHGTGTNALLLSPPDAIAPAFGPGSCERHRELAAAAGAACRVAELPSLALDVDTPDDLDALAATLEGQRGRSRLTIGALHQLDRSHAPAPMAAARADEQVRA